MDEVQTGATEEPTGAQPPATDSRPTWFRRPSIRTLRKRNKWEEGRSSEQDRRENEDTRLPNSEKIHFGGLVLAEAFTPSTVSHLYQVLRAWPPDQGRRSRVAVQHLERSRAGEHGGWVNLGVVRPPGNVVFGDGYNDPDLPPGVDAVWIQVSYVTPALAIVVATFTIAEEAGDLSTILRTDYSTTASKPYVFVRGRLATIRGRISWARPAKYTTGYTINGPEHQKRQACSALIASFEASCGAWFHSRFPGRFARSDLADRPMIHLLFTREGVPFAGRKRWFAPPQIDFALPLWRSTEQEGWRLRQGLWPYDDRRPILRLAARRKDIARESTEGESGESNWDITQRFGTEEAALASRYALGALLSVYSRRLAALRDRARSRRFFVRPVKDARDLDRYLVGDGLDAATIASDVAELTNDLKMFRYGMPEFTEDLTELPSRIRDSDPLELAFEMCADLRRKAERLDRDTAATTGNLRASAELRQAVANTTLQRFTVGLSLVAVIVALVSLVIATR